MTALVMLGAVLVDLLLGEPRRWHPLVGFGRYASYLEARLNVTGTLASALEARPGGAGSHTASLEPPLSVRASHAVANRLRGVAAVLVAVCPPVVVCLALTHVQSIRPAIELAVLYFSVGHQSLRKHAMQVYQALAPSPSTSDSQVLEPNAERLKEARRRVGMIVSRDTGGMDEQAVTVAAVESVLENGSDAVFAPLFWFAVAGAPAVLLHRLVNTLDAMWGYRTPRYFYFGWAAARLDDVLNFIPARLTAFTYALIGNTSTALRCWRRQARAWESPNAGPVMAAGAGALGVALGGGAFYHGHWKERPPLGDGRGPDAVAITGALRLVAYGVALWILVVGVVEVLRHA